MNRAVLFMPALALAAGIGTVAGSATERRPEALVRSGALTQGSAADVLAHDGTAVPAALARVIAEEVAPEVPLPRGGTFDGIRWEQVGSAISR